jgi:hypothetical protein
VSYGQKKVRSAARRLKTARKQPTYVALSPDVILHLKREAEERGVVRKPDFALSQWLESIYPGGRACPAEA